MSTHFVVAIPPSYTDRGELETQTTSKYLDYLARNKTTTVMTTAGTSQFNLLTLDEIHEFNEAIVKSFCGNKIVGIPALSTHSAVEFVKKAGNYVDKTTHFMALYPDRYYDHTTIKNHISAIRESTDLPLYLHGMTMRSGYGGAWNFTSDVLCDLFEDQCLMGIKEEHTDFKKSYDFVSGLPKEMDIIVAGGSMRRHQYLHSAGANAFLSGVGNLFPEIELGYCNALDNLQDVNRFLDLETKLFNVFMKNGWHHSLRIALSVVELTCLFDRKPWPKRDDKLVDEIRTIIEEIGDEK